MRASVEAWSAPEKIRGERREEGGEGEHRRARSKGGGSQGHKRLQQSWESDQ